MTKETIAVCSPVTWATIMVSRWIKRDFELLPA